MGLPTILFLIFLVLKLTGQIDWSWWWVTAPIWIELIVTFLILFVFGVGSIFATKKQKPYQNNRMNRW